MSTVQKTAAGSQQRILEFDLSSELHHGMLVSNLAYAVAEELAKGGKVQLVGFGNFEVSERPAREGRNPRTGETMTIAASKTPKFKPGKALKDEINK